MHRLIATLCVIFVIIATFTVSGRPTDNLVRYKRQSDQRLAELETLLALQKYRHRLRPDRKQESQAGYGAVDFNLIGRRKKSLRYSPGEEQHTNHAFRAESLSPSNRDSVLQEESAVDPSLNEKIDSLLSYKSLVLHDNRKDSLQYPAVDLNEDKK